MKEERDFLPQLPNKSWDACLTGLLLLIGCGISLKSQSGVWQPARIQTVQFMSGSGISSYRRDSLSRNECQQCEEDGSLFNLVGTAVAMKSYNASVFLRVFSCELCIYSLPSGVESGRSDHFVNHFSDVIGMRQSRCNSAWQRRFTWGRRGFKSVT